jgi:hypothetical protein
MPKPLFDPALLHGADIGRALERASAMIGRLDARVSASPVASPWSLRASWTGYARALQLSGQEIDEIDVFSWGTGVVIPDRRVRTTIANCYAAFPLWRTRMAQKGRHWAEDLPFTPLRHDASTSSSALAHAFELLSQWLNAEPGLDAWLAMPILLHRLGLTDRPLPCLVAGDARLALGTRDPGALMRRLLAELAERAETALQSLKAMESARSQAIAILRGQHRPGTLPALLALLQLAPVQTPAAVARRLEITLSGAGKLLQRAATLGLIREVSNRGSWRLYMTPDLAVALGFESAPRGRPPHPPAAPEEFHSALVSTFDDAMADWDRRFGTLGSSNGKSG